MYFFPKKHILDLVFSMYIMAVMIKIVIAHISKDYMRYFICLLLLHNYSPTRETDIEANKTSEREKEGQSI